MLKKYSSRMVRLFHEPHSFEQLLQRELWTQDIVGMMAVIMLVASGVILAGVLAGILEFAGTLPIYFALALVLPVWWYARHGGWRLARIFPGLICFALGVYIAFNNGFSPSAALFFALAVLVNGVLLGTAARWWTVLIATLAFSLLSDLKTNLPFSETIPLIITTFFTLTGVAAIQWYTDMRLNQTFSAMIAHNQALQAEVTRREHAEQVQREQEAALQRLAENTTDLISEIDLNGVIRYASPSHRSGLGFEPNALVGSNVFALLHPADIEKGRIQMMKTAADRKPARILLRVRNAQGHYLTMEVSGSLLCCDDGAPNGFVLSSRDMTQQQEAEQANAASERKFRNIIESFPLGIHMYTLEPGDRLVFSGYNSAADRILAVEHAPLMGKTIEEAFPNLAGTELPHQYRKTASGGAPWHLESINYADNQVQGCYEVHAYQAAPGMVVIIFDDITNRIRTAEALRLSEYKFSTAFHTSPDSININRMVDGVYLDINEGFTKIMGYQPQEVIGKSSLELNIWADPADRERLVKGLIASGEVDNLEARFRKKDGSVGIGLMSARVIMINGEKCILSITREITNWIRAQLELRETHAKLEEAYEATLQGWTNALQLREKETAEHSRRVVALTVAMAQRMGFHGEALDHIRRGALLHDIGKMGVADHILLKPGPLTPEEWIIMRQHVQYAYEMIKSIPYLHPSIDIPYCHHERWDGAGYPRKLSGEEIPLAARIFAVADVYDALLSNRPYRPAWPEAEVLHYLKEQSGQQFDPQIVGVFLDMIQEPARQAADPP